MVSPFVRTASPENLRWKSNRSEEADISRQFAEWEGSEMAVERSQEDEVRKEAHQSTKEAP